jgi:aspartyl-tRNA(Asn)/glutamyl-tRNA(Gln) amidotransferase subunit A
MPARCLFSASFNADVAVLIGGNEVRVFDVTRDAELEANLVAIAEDFRAAFTQCDVIAGPVAPTVAWKLGDKADDPVANYLADIFTLPASLAGLPGMSLPCGFGEGGMPVGLQLIGNYFGEARLLNAAHRFQQATDFHLRQPEGF